MRCLVTGVAGFIGSHLAERLVRDGYEVIGVDCFTDFYSRRLKEANLAGLRGSPRFRLVEADLAVMEVEEVLEGVEYVFHHAAQAGVRPSWGRSFEVYERCNVLGTQRLLEAVARCGEKIRRLIYASSSSVYGDVEDLPMREDGRVQPVSPYGVTKLAAEHLCHLYWKSYGIPVVSLRYFTVYGPRQRPDMAFNRFIRATLGDQPIVVYGDGKQTRDFTFVTDAVEANVLAMERGKPGRVYNIGGGSQITLRGVLEILEEVVGKRLQVVHQPTQRGEMRHTYADVSLAKQELGYAPQVGLAEGLTEEFAWFKAQDKGDSYGYR